MQYKHVICTGLLLALTSPGHKGYAATNPFNVTDGQITKAAGGRWQTNSAEMRATLKERTAQRIAANFTYLGATRAVSKLGDGSVRHQFGFKLKAQDICNLVYVMWHFEQEHSVIEVLAKSNPGEATSEQCHDGGYTVIADIPVPYVQVDVPRSLGAEIEGSNLTVTADGETVWKGMLPPIVSSLNGPVGFRSDNAHVVFDYSVGK